MASASEELWILGIHMTKFGKHPDKDVSTSPPRRCTVRWPTAA